MTDEQGPEKVEPGADPEGPLAEASLLMLVATLSAQAAHHLGVSPQGEETEPDLRMAKYTIDLLGVLAEKTEGNLTEEEKSYLDGQLFGLRMRYVEASKGGS